MINRIKQIIDSRDLNLSGNVSYFAKTIRMEQTTVNNYIIGKRKMSLDFIVNILTSYPDISAEWLLRGEGPMLKSVQPEVEAAPQPSAFSSDMQGVNSALLYLTRRCEELEAEVENLKQPQKAEQVA